MFVRALKPFETPSHNLHAGALADLPIEQAQQAIEEGNAQAVDVERALAEMSGTETATAEPGKRVDHAIVAAANVDLKASGKPGGGKTPSWAK